MTTRRKFLGVAASTTLLPHVADATSKTDDLIGQIGLTTGSFTRFFSPDKQAGKLLLLDLPRIMRDELDLRVLDLMTANLPSMETAYLETLRRRAEDARCIITNLKMNQKNVDMGTTDSAKRKTTLKVYKKTIDAAHVLGCRWVRPLPRSGNPDMKTYVENYRELIDYAKPKGITLLIENFGWIKSDPAAVPRIIQAVGPGLEASVDTGNWDDAVRYDGLAKAYPLAVTCDFKAFQLDENNQHDRYDLEKCFRIGWETGYRGPWCFEHFNKTLPGVFAGMKFLREQIRQWSR